MIGQLTDGLTFSIETATLGFIEFAADHLDGDPPAVCELACAIHRGKATRSNIGFNLVADESVRTNRHRRPLRSRLARPAIESHDFTDRLTLHGAKVPEREPNGD